MKKLLFALLAVYLIFRSGQVAIVPDGNSVRWTRTHVIVLANDRIIGMYPSERIEGVIVNDFFKST